MPLLEPQAKQRLHPFGMHRSTLVLNVLRDPRPESVVPLQVAQNLNPIWNETFEFKELSGGEHLRLRVFDSDKLQMDQSLGVARVNLLVGPVGPVARLHPE